MYQASARWLPFRAASTLAAIVVAGSAQAQSEQPSGTPAVEGMVIARPVALAWSEEPGGITLRVRNWRWPAAEAPRFERPSARRAQSNTGDSKAARAVNRAIAGVGGAAVGFMVGGLVGSKLEPSCRCDDPGLRGFIIGAPIGAAVLATAAVLSVK